MLYQMNRRTEVTINTPFGETENIEKEEEIVKQGKTYGPIMCCTSAIRVNDIGEKISCKQGDKDMSAVGDAEEIRKGIRN